MESYPLEQYLKMINHLHSNDVHAELSIGEALTVKIYKNGAIDVKVTNNFISTFLDHILEKTFVEVAG